MKDKDAKLLEDMYDRIDPFERDVISKIRKPEYELQKTRDQEAGKKFQIGSIARLKGSFLNWDTKKISAVKNALRGSKVKITSFGETNYLRHVVVLGIDPKINLYVGIIELEEIQ